MGQLLEKTSKRPFEAVESVWSPATAPHLAFRTYLAQTLDGFLRAFFETASNSGMYAGLLHVPNRLSHVLDWWPVDSTSKSPHLFQFDGKSGDEWKRLKADFKPQSAPGRELWAIWAGKTGCGMLMARRPITRHRGSVLPLDAWQILICWQADVMLEGMDRLNECLQPYESLKAPLDRLTNSLPMVQPERRQPFNPALRSALTLADHMDPWTRRQLTETTWVQLIKQIQENVAWELRIEKLLPAIGEIIHDTLGYDFCEILVFSRPGKRHEEFLSWRKNMTGYGGRAMTMLLDEKIVARLVRERKPRLIGTGEEDGLMNPHLAEIARLREGLIIPLSYEKRVVGILSLFYQYPTGLQQKELERMQQVGEVIARSVENSNAHENMRRMATVDPLTSLYNRRSFTDQIMKEMRRSQRYKQRFSLILIDLDNFKNYNDNNGHLMGDHLLQQLAQVLKKSVRAQDIVCRYGGEEFAIILPHTSLDDGYVVAEKIRSIVAETTFPAMESQPAGFVSLSAGIADTRQGAATHQELVDQADRALYYAKEMGRNRSEKYNEDLASQT
ncbi:sensor domain-containing diguanylate cyclase [bacterium]|nr:sensor domain-containing diguanylate cyclase [bacterium]